MPWLFRWPGAALLRLGDVTTLIDPSVVGTLQALVAGMNKPEGTVASVNVLTVKIRTPKNEEVTIPSSLVVDVPYRTPVRLSVTTTPTRPCSPNPNGTERLSHSAI